MLPYPALHPGQAAFADIRREQEFYVDKTRHFRRLLDTGGAVGTAEYPPRLLNSHLFFARPRRFGKSLLIDTLEVWFQGLSPGHVANPEQETKDWAGLPEGWTCPSWLWDGLDAEDWHGHHGWHPVIRLDMARAAAPTPQGTWNGLQAYLNELIDLWEWLGVPWGDKGIPGHGYNDPPNKKLNNLITGLGRCYRKRPVVLVDEYDAPITNHMGSRQDIRPAVGALRDFYRTLKDDPGLLYGVFITGITTVAREHLFSSLNNLTDISEYPEYGDLCGFTEDETRQGLAPHRDALTAMEPRFREQDILGTWRNLYNGYRFSPYPDTPRMYNPFTLIQGMHGVLSTVRERQAAVEGNWPSAWAKSGHAGLTVRLAEDTHQSMPGVVWEGGMPPLPAPELGDLSRPDYSRLMLDTGYYTWHGGKEGRSLHLNFPNREVAAAWTGDILGIWKHPLHKDNALIEDLHCCLRQGDVKGFCHRLESFTSKFAGENLQSESSFRTLLQALFLQMGEPTQSEKSSQGGRVDHELRIGKRMYVIEAKYNRPVNEALRQIRERPYGREHLDMDWDVTALALAYRRDLKSGPMLQCEARKLADLLAGREQESEDREEGWSPTL